MRMAAPMPREPVIALVNVTKRFPGVVALDGVGLELRPGEVHVLLGENGAGKSTLVGILSGRHRPDGGAVVIDGAARRLDPPRAALSSGIGTVFQHALLAPTLTVEENLLLDTPWWQRPKRAELRGQAHRLASELDVLVPLDARVSKLSPAERQQAEILRALLRDSRVLLLDEATSMLAPAGVDRLGALMGRLAERGVGIVLVTHKLREALAFGDRISVLRRGRKVGEIPPERLKGTAEDAPAAEIVAMMFGSAPPNLARQGSRAEALAARGRPVLKVSGLSLPPDRAAPGLSTIDLDVGAGEIVGIAGIEGQGQREFAELLSGQRRDGSGSIRLDGREIAGLTLAERRALGLRHLSDDRLGEGIAANLSVAHNLFLKRIGQRPFWRLGWERRRAIGKNAVALARAYDIRATSVDAPAGNLSGGNVQKILLARELDEGARLAICSKPTHGLDLATAAATRARIRGLAQRGAGVLLISSDLDELIDLASRIVVLRGGAVAGVVAGGSSAREKVGRLMAGAAA
ncbi:MAG TPA: ABC transporter ATP-binding protein [Mesorhizobium sp.]|jgi:simple sugar transport system ATP-binding protein|nr:ABC transporter ATP-binding protein [Mesorhizobium sp.]